jgi:hypothetical protein
VVASIQGGKRGKKRRAHIIVLVLSPNKFSWEALLANSGTYSEVFGIPSAGPF